MRTSRMLTLIVLSTSVMVLAGAAQAQEVSIRIDKHARLAPDGSVTFTARVLCGPLPGMEDVREGLAGAGQSKTGAAAEGGLSPTIICDGIERVYTAGVSLLGDAVFERGPARAFVTVFACNTVEEDQICVQASARRRIIISGRSA